MLDERYFEEAIVLARENRNDIDGYVHLYTKGAGKLSARIKSARKITSKLSPHLQEGNVVTIRLIEKNGLQVVDVLKNGKVNVGFRDLYALNKLLESDDFDFNIWTELIGDNQFNWRRVLGFLGWDPEFALCGACNKKRPSFFDISRQDFVCQECFNNHKSYLNDKGIVGLKPPVTS